MDGFAQGIDVRRLGAEESDRTAALNLIFDGRPDAAGAGPAAEGFDAYMRKYAAMRELLVGAYCGGRMEGACVAVLSPGRGGLLFASLEARGAIGAEATVAALTALRVYAWQESVSLLEVLLSPEASACGSTLKRSGFRFLTRLLYLERPPAADSVATTSIPDLEWVEYSSRNETVFCDALVASYLGSMDCPGLTGIRRTPDVLASHRATGEHDPALWWVATRGGAPVGILLLTRLSTLSALEIVYMGVAQPSRGQGVGDMLLARAVAATEADSATRLSVTVDVANTPARKLYGRWGFVETGKRDAWIANPDVA